MCDMISHANLETRFIFWGIKESGERESLKSERRVSEKCFPVERVLNFKRELNLLQNL